MNNIYHNIQYVYERFVHLPAAAHSSIFVIEFPLSFCVLYLNTFFPIFIASPLNYGTPSSCEANESVKSTSIKYEYTYETLPVYQQQTANDGGGGDGIDVAMLSSDNVRIFFF